MLADEVGKNQGLVERVLKLTSHDATESNLVESETRNLVFREETGFSLMTFEDNSTIRREHIRYHIGKAEKERVQLMKARISKERSPSIFPPQSEV